MLKPLVAFVELYTYMYNVLGHLCLSIYLAWKITTGDLSSHIKLSHLSLQIRSPKPLPSPPAFVSLNAEHDRISTLLMVLISAWESNSMAILEANLGRERANPCWALRSVAGNTLSALSCIPHTCGKETLDCCPNMDRVQQTRVCL